MNHIEVFITTDEHGTVAIQPTGGKIPNGKFRLIDSSELRRKVVAMRNEAVQAAQELKVKQSVNNAENVFANGRANALQGVIALLDK